MTPRRIVAVGILLLALSGGGFAVVEAMHPPDRILTPAMKRISEQWVYGEISYEEFTRQSRTHATHVGICGYFLTYRAYPICRTLALGGALAGLTLIAAGAIRARRRSVATPPGS